MQAAVSQTVITSPKVTFTVGVAGSCHRGDVLLSVKNICSPSPSREKGLITDCSNSDDSNRPKYKVKVY